MPLPAKSPNSLRTTLAIASLAALPLSGCVTAHEVGDQTIYRHPAILTVLLVALGVGLAAAGVPLLLGRWKPKGKPRVVGALLFIAGSLVAVITATSLPFERLIISPTLVRMERGTLGKLSEEVDLQTIDKLIVYKARFARDNPKHSVGPHTFVEFAGENTPSVHLRMRETKWASAVEHLLRLAEEQGIEIDDQRDQYTPFIHLR